MSLERQKNTGGSLGVADASSLLLGRAHGRAAHSISGGFALHREDDFAELLPALEDGVSFGARFERQDSVDDGTKASRRDQPQDGFQLGFRAHVRPEYGDLSPEEKGQIEFGILTGGDAAGNQASAAGQAGDALVPGLSADVLEDDVHATAICETLYFLVDSIKRPGG